jgi:hypothetical protein
MKQIILASIVSLALVAFANSALADNITVTNFSFENPSVADVPGGYALYSSIQAWTFGGSSDFSGVQLMSTQYSSAQPANSDGYQDAVFNLSGGETGTITYTTSGDSSDNGVSLGTIQSNTDYSLTVALGNRDGTGAYGDPGDVSLNIQAGTGTDTSTYTTVATMPVTPGEMPDGAFTDFTVTLYASYILSHPSLLGENLGIQITATGVDSYTDQNNFDNVQLTETSVPEPRTWALIGFGGLVFLAGLNRIKRRA